MGRIDRENLSDLRQELCVGYARVSTSKEEQQTSFYNQQDIIEEIVKNRNGRFLCCYADNGETGTKNNREEFIRLLNDAGVKIYANGGAEIIGKPKFKHIFVKSTSRFARNVGTDIILKRIAQNGVCIHFLDCGIDYSMDNNYDWMTIQILLSVSENYSINLSNNVKMGKRRSDANGRLRAQDMYGYRYISEENRLEIYEPEAAVVRKIFELHLQGYGARRIKNYLRENGIKTFKGCDVWSDSQLKRLMSNEKYAGLNNAGKFYVRDLFDAEAPSRRQRKENYEVKETDKIPPIVSKEVFYKAQEITEKERKRVNKPQGYYVGKGPLAGRVFCGKCGATYYRNTSCSPNIENYKYYNCKQKHLYGVKLGCDNINIKEELILKHLELDYSYHLVYISNEFYRLAVEMGEEISEIIRNSSVKNKEMELAQIEERLKKIDKLINYYEEKIIEDNTSGYQFQKRLNDFFEEKEELFIRKNYLINSEIKELNEIAYIYKKREVISKEADFILSLFKDKKEYINQEDYFKCCKVIVYPDRISIEHNFERILKDLLRDIDVEVVENDWYSENIEKLTNELSDLNFKNRHLQLIADLIEELMKQAEKYKNKGDNAPTVKERDEYYFRMNTILSKINELEEQANKL